MSRKCNACGLENRDEAKFCSSCGSPLPAVKKQVTAQELAHKKAVKKFWIIFFCCTAAAALVLLLVSKQMSHAEKVRTVSRYSTEFMQVDDKTFGAVKPELFSLEAMNWGMTPADIKRIYPYATDSNDPDFPASIMVPQSGFTAPIPHAYFMSLGMYNGKLFAVKFEFGENEKFESQALKTPNKDEVLYGRFLGLYNLFNRDYGAPSFEKFEVKNMPLEEMLKTVNSGVLKDGKPSNIYVAWNVGATKVELAFFGYDNKLHLTLRFLNIVMWDEAARAQQTGKYRTF
ncbi:MAG: zinc ribbon domain-containing protein [Spirochaetia bacterium]|nr:zinc ribbon domain-containing protein [Spirochaetia bacterium]